MAMTTGTAVPIERPRAGTRSTHECERRIVLRDISWETYEALAGELGDQPVRLSFDRGVLEIMSPSPLHERYKKLLGRLVEELLVGLGLAFEAAGESRWSRAEVARGLEADECYYLAAAKLAVVRGRAPDRPDDPLPDLAVEIDVSPSQADRPGIYAALGVTEVWRFDGERLRIEGLRNNGGYEDLPQSRFLPVRPEEVVERIRRAEALDQTAWTLEIRDWVRDEVAPRHRAAPDGV
jgi:Uma2 family endonuclease